MCPRRTDLWRVLGSASRQWADPALFDIGDEHWLACSGGTNVNYNLACCHTAELGVMGDRCLQPLVDLRKPAIVMLCGAGLATAQLLVEAGWVSIGALPIMSLPERNWSASATGVSAEVIELARDDLPSAREILVDTYGLDPTSAIAALPDASVGGEGIAVWGIRAGGRLVGTVTTVVEEGLVVIWSMATLTECQGRGLGRALLDAVLGRTFATGATGSILHSSVQGERLYRALGYEVVEYLQLWSRPRWVLALS